MHIALANFSGGSVALHDFRPARDSCRNFRPKLSPQLQSFIVGIVIVIGEQFAVRLIQGGEESAAIQGLPVPGTLNRNDTGNPKGDGEEPPAASRCPNWCPTGVFDWQRRSREWQFGLRPRDGGVLLGTIS